MKKTILILIFVLTTMTFCNAQKIERERIFGGYKYTQSGKILTMADLVKKMESNQEAYALMKKAQSTNSLLSIIGFAGGGLIGWPLGAAISGDDPKWTLAGIGAGLIAVGIPISSGVNKKAKQAIELYNSSLNSTTFYESKPEFKLIANGNGIGLSMHF